ncbi:MAG: hypothetical protein ALECFALPRED_007972 [Alectoria fallacina]|uniref:Uncharacterized protein n=1 Tax=Alectoria fallacina TaxID=1903189 RepID=A0A8H3J1U1_9LECA|nr:MAG: hypothetical protein ALECFALPRED_007972 [Alectoria fallacina]
MRKRPLGGPYGERLLPQVIDVYAKSDPERIYALVPHSAQVTQGFRKITMKGLASAVHCLVDRRRDWTFWQFRDIGFYGCYGHSLQYFLLRCHQVWLQVLGSVGKEFCIRECFSLEGVQTYQGFCNGVYGRKDSGLGEEHTRFAKFHPSSLDDLLTGSSEHYPYDKLHAEDVKDPVPIPHTSGSTGAPKPIILPNGAFSVIDNQRRLSKLEGRKNMDYSLFDLQGQWSLTHYRAFMLMESLP